MGHNHKGTRSIKLTNSDHQHGFKAVAKVNLTALKINLAPTEVHQFGPSETMAMVRVKNSAPSTHFLSRFRATRFAAAEARAACRK
jgi:hypothetical protein